MHHVVSFSYLACHTVCLSREEDEILFPDTVNAHHVRQPCFSNLNSDTLSLCKAFPLILAADRNIHRYAHTGLHREAQMV